jgi:hypothetical protein
MTTRRTKADKIASSAWKDFYNSPEGKVAIGTLFRDFGFIDTPTGNDFGTMARSIGQRDVLVRISQMINLKPEQAPDIERDTSDILDRIMRTA